MQAVRIRPTSLISLEEIGDDILSTFAMALEKLRIEEHDSEKAEITIREETNGNVFRREGDVWIIIREGKEFPPIKHESGMSLISHLLFHRGTAFQSPLDLEVAIDGSQAGSSVLGNMTQEQLEKEGFGTQGLVDRVGADNTALQAYRKQLNEIENELEKAEKHNDPARYDVLNKEKEALLKEITGASILAQKGPQDHANEKARKRVSSAIHRALNSIQEHEPEGFGLSSHLRKHLIPVSFPYSYAPDQPIDWTI